MNTKLRSRIQGESGFTLVELLVVMLILGLLAAIAIPAFFNQRIKAQDAEAKSIVKTAQTSLETYATDHQGSYASATRSNLHAIEPTLSTATSGANAITTLTTTANSYTITVRSASNNTFSIQRSSTGVLTYPCGTAGTGGCPSGTVGWG